MLTLDMRTLRVLAAIGVLALITGGGLSLAALFPSVLKVPVALLITQDEPMKADLIVVLSPNTAERTLGARDLYMRGFARKILLIPDPPNPLRPELEKLGFKKPPYSGSQRILMGSGVPSSVIDLLPTHAENTNDETRLVRAYAAERGAKSILLVTSPIHSRRACWMFKRNVPSVHISCQPSTYGQIKYDRKLTLRVINEYLKIAANGLGIN